ncbi:MAG: hypothetical protein ACYSTZ_07090 [Planctomycetota bacterium]
MARLGTRSRYLNRTSASAWLEITHKVLNGCKIGWTRSAWCGIMPVTQGSLTEEDLASDERKG